MTNQLKLMSSFNDFKQFHVEDQCSARANLWACTAITVSQVRRDNEAVLAANAHQL